MFRLVVSGWSAATIVTALAGLVLAGCGGGANQAAGEPRGTFPVAVSTASFPAHQTLAERTEMVIRVRNAGTKTIPDIAVTITDANEGTAAEPFAEDLHMSGLADPSRPVWIVDEAPCPASASDGCDPAGPGGERQRGGPGGAVSAYANTWAMGRLAAGASATFRWGVTAVQPGVHMIRYQVAAGLNGRARAVPAGGQGGAGTGGSSVAEGHPLSGTFVIHISSAPQQSYVNDAGQIVTVR